MPRLLFANANVFTADSRRWAHAIVVQDDRILYVGDAETAARIAGDDAERVDLGGNTILPGFVDGHAHVVGTGEASQQVNLWGAQTVDEIQRRIGAWAVAHPDEPRILVQGWAHAALGGDQPHRQMLDAVVSDRPVYAQSYDYHSIWLNTAALEEVGIDATTNAPDGGQIYHDADGPTGLIDETAMHTLVWPFLDETKTPEDLDRHLTSALDSYRELGVTASTEMALDEGDLLALSNAEQRGELTARIAAHWRVQPTGNTATNLAQVERAIELSRLHNSGSLRVVGIKVLIDGTVDGCTAALGKPYANGSNADPIWSREELIPVVIAADRANLQIAMHAIGDEAIRVAIDSIEAAISANGPRERRHRIEHLEVVTKAEIDRLAALGITASMQPVHADPAIQDNWRAMLADERIDRGFPWPEMTEAGAQLVFGTDSPTSPQAPLANMFVASTRQSALNPELEANNPALAVPLMEAVEHATRDAAWACRAEHDYGRIAAGLFADFIVLDRDIFTAPPEHLLNTQIVRTVVGGRTIFERLP